MISMMSIWSVSAVVLCLRSESRNLFRQSDLALHLIGNGVELRLDVGRGNSATFLPVVSHPCRNLRRKVGGDLVRLCWRWVYVQALTACLWPTQSIPWMVVSVHLYFVCMYLKIAFSRRRHVPCVCVCFLRRSRWSPDDIWHLQSLVDQGHVCGVVTAVGTVPLVCQLGYWVLHLEGAALWEFCRLGGLGSTRGWMLPWTAGDS
jgi:hypothetical protein